ncbi:MAG: hypothetical protein JWL64_2442 [Frankiales bacterium]|nr:hypothetical protein [Frankiales bacterium]
MDVTQHQEALRELSTGLVDEYSAELSAGTVLRCVARCRDELLLIGVRDGLVEAVEAMARSRLRERALIAAGA